MIPECHVKLQLNVGEDFARSLSGHWLKMLHFNSNTSSLMSFMIAG